jgi:O-glycosyl hydrolase
MALLRKLTMTFVRLSIVFLFLLTTGAVGLSASRIQTPKTPTLTSTIDSITIDPVHDHGRTFDGVGGISAGASSRLLFDYPEPQRSQILDYLFKPNYGAAVQLLKVEIGGDMNSTCGSEASHMRSRNDLSGSRGYEWWLMKEAKKRNPEIKLLALEWGVPGWCKGGFWSQDNVDYVMKWLELARQQNLTIDYVGGWNERAWNVKWYLALHEALAKEFPHVRIIAADNVYNMWGVVGDLMKHPDFAAVVDVVGVHDPCIVRTDYLHCYTPRQAIDLGKPLWTSEQSSQGHDVGAAPLARALTRQYIEGRMTGNLNWALVSAWYSNLPLGDTGLLLADRPWSGYYDVGKSIWVDAHITQFTKPGWQYLDQACAYLPGGASCVAMKSPDASDYTLLIETMDQPSIQSVPIKIVGPLADKPAQLWSTDLFSNDPAQIFHHDRTLIPQNGAMMLDLAPGHLYTLSTTTGQAKGNAQPHADPATELPLPYSEDFESYPPGHLARFFSDINGGFETASCSGGRSGMCYRQVVPQPPIGWDRPMPPTTILGDPRWWGDYQLATDVYLEGPGYIELLARISSQRHLDVSGYHLRFDDTGHWMLYSQESDQKDITLASGDSSFTARTWHRVALSMQNDLVSIILDGQTIGQVHDTHQRAGQVGLRTGPWQAAEFDNLQITRTAPWPEFIPHSEMSVSATSAHKKNYGGYTYEAANAIDDRPETFWHTEWEPHTTLPQSITLDLGHPRKIQGLAYRPRLDIFNGMITQYAVLLSLDGVHFDQVASGQWPISRPIKIATWPSQSARYVRLEAIKGENNNASAAELNVAISSLVPAVTAKAMP